MVSRGVKGTENFDTENVIHINKNPQLSFGRELRVFLATVHPAHGVTVVAVY